MAEKLKVYLWKMTAYNIEDPKKSEFHNYQFTAPSWELATKIYSGLSGEYGCPEDRDYDLSENGFAYMWDGENEDEWLESIRSGYIMQENIKSFRLGLGWTQKKLAEELSNLSEFVDISHRTVQNWEQGRRKPDKKSSKLIDALKAKHPGIL